MVQTYLKLNLKKYDFPLWEHVHIIDVIKQIISDNHKRLKELQGKL